jgi:hypothetical protein
MPTAELAEHEDMDRWTRLPVWAQQQWRVDVAFQRGRAEQAEKETTAAQYALKVEYDRAERYKFALLRIAREPKNIGAARAIVQELRIG